MSTPEELLFEACYNNQVEDVKKLLEQHPNIKINKLMSNGWGALHHPSMKDHISIVKLLLQHPDVDVNITTQWGGTPFSLACSSGSTSVVRELLGDQRVEINEQDKYGATPLWKAAHEGNLDAVKWILASGRKVDLGAKDKNWGYTALETAKNRAVEEVGRNRNSQSAVGLEIRRKNCPLIVNLLERFKNNPEQTTNDLRKELGVTDFPVAAPNNNRASFLYFMQSFNVIPKDIFVTIQPPPTFYPAKALIQLVINTSLPVSALKEKIQDITGIPITQQKIFLETGEALGGDQAKILSFNVVDSAKLVLQNDLLKTEASPENVPKAIKDCVASSVTDPELNTFLSILSTSPNLQAAAVQKLQQMTSEQFLRWVRDCGGYCRLRYGKPVDYTVVTPQKVDALKAMLIRFSKDLGSVASAGKSKLRKELSSHAITLFHKDVDAQQAEAVEIYNKRKFVKRPAGIVAPEDLLTVRLYTLPKNEVQPLFFQCIDSSLKETIEGSSRNRASMVEDGKRDKDKERDKESWKHGVSHLCKATAELRGCQGILYRGHPAVSPDLEQLRAGSVVTFHNFTTCLTHLDAARRLSENKTLFEITLTKEFGCFVKDYSPLRIEHEVLLPPFTFFRVTSVERDVMGSALYVCMEGCQIPPAITPLLPPVPVLTPEEEKSRLRTEFFMAIVEGNALFFLFNKKNLVEFVKEKNDRGQTALHIAARQPGSEFVMTWLLHRGADVNATDLNGSTPLHFAVAAKQKTLTKILIQKGALLDIKNHAGKVPMDENPEFLTAILAKLKKGGGDYEMGTLDPSQKKGKSKSQEFESATLPPRLVSSHSETPLVSSPATPHFEAIEMRSVCLKQIAALEKDEKITKVQAKAVRLKIMKEDVSVIAACQAYDNDPNLLAETLIEYLQLTE